MNYKRYQAYSSTKLDFIEESEANFKNAMLTK